MGGFALHNSLTTVVLLPVPTVTPEVIARVQYIEEKLKEVEEGGKVKVRYCGVDCGV